MPVYELACGPAFAAGRSGLPHLQSCSCSTASCGSWYSRAEGRPDWKAGSSRAQSKGGGSDTESAGSAARKPVLAPCYNPTLVKPDNEVRIRPMPGLRGWAIWAAALAIVLLLNGIVWALVIAY